jgi:hypothetical protein
MANRDRNKAGKKTDEFLLATIEKNPGLSQYELANKLGWHSGHVDGSVRRLLKAGRVYIRVLERNGRRVNLVYPKDQKPSNVLEVPVELLKAGNPAWGECAFFHALDSSTIGVSGQEVPEWVEVSCFVETVAVQREDGRLVLRIPENFWRFYNLDRTHRVVSVNGNNILITVSGDIVEEKEYPS